MDIASHFWRLAQHIGLRATVLVHTPLDPGLFADRKALSNAVWRVSLPIARVHVATESSGGAA